MSTEEGKRGSILASDKNKKIRKICEANLNKSIIARNRMITKQSTLKHQRNKTDQNLPITNHKP